MMRTKVTDQCVRLAMAIVIIVLISLGLYSFSSHAGAGEPSVTAISLRH